LHWSRHQLCRFEEIVWSSQPLVKFFARVGYKYIRIRIQDYIIAEVI
jgi:hypothetical protein